jgi:hypothetical protein
MPRYLVQVVCSQCAQRHPVWVSLDSERALRTDTNVDIAFLGRALPQEISELIERRFQCPNTARFYVVRDATQMYLEGA